jgi:hypothetical protein
MKIAARRLGCCLFWIVLMFAAADAFAANDTPAVAANDEPAVAANDASRCLALHEVHGGYPRYRIIDGRRCWYASTRGPDTAKPMTIDVNPYDDPIWHQPDASAGQAAASRAKNCEEQALKLDLKEKRAFMKQCMTD